MNNENSLIILDCIKRMFDVNNTRLVGVSKWHDYQYFTHITHQTIFILNVLMVSYTNTLAYIILCTLTRHLYSL